MNRTITTNHNRPTTDASQMVNVVLEIERPSAEELADYPRDERYRRLRANTEAHRHQLKGWLDRQRLTDEVAAMSPATGFNLLFVKCTTNAAQALAHAPGVIDIMYTDDAADLLQYKPVAIQANCNTGANRL